MVWKPKEKELTREEAIALAKKELAPFWIASAPLFTAVSGTALPLDPEFEKTSWLITVTDPTRFDGEAATQLLLELQRRYGSFGYSGLLVLRAPYSPFRERASAEHFSRRLRTQFPVCIDHDGKIATAFGAGEQTRFLLLHANRAIFHVDGDPYTGGLETLLQKHLRSLDAGLALPVLFTPPASSLADQDVFHGGELPGFVTGRDGFRHLDRTDPKAKVQLHGNWMQDRERLATNDAKATLSLDVSGGSRMGVRSLSVVAQSLSKSGEPARIEIEAAGTVVFDIFGGADLAFDEEGRSIVRVVEPRAYYPIRNLPPDRSQITLRFPSADQVPIAIYGLRVGRQGV